MYSKSDFTSNALSPSYFGLTYVVPEGCVRSGLVSNGTSPHHISSDVFNFLVALGWYTGGGGGEKATEVSDGRLYKRPGEIVATSVCLENVIF